MRTASRRRRRPGTRSSEVDPEMLLLMPCGFHLAETMPRMGAHAAARRVRGPDGGPSRPGLRARRLGVLQPARPAGHRRHRAPGRDLRPGRVRGHRAVRVVDAGRRPRGGGRPVPFRATFDCLWCGTAHTCRGPGRPRGLGAALPRLRRQGRRQRLPAVPAPPGPDRAGRSGPAAARPPAARSAAATRRRTPRRRPPRRRPDARRRDARLLRGPRARVRRLVPAARPLRARPGPRRRLERRARRRRSLARRAARSTARSSSSRPERAGGRRCSPSRASCRCTTGPPRPSIGPASGSSRTACAPTSTSATPGPSPTARSTRVFTGFWLSHVPRDRLDDVPRDRPALAQARAGRSPSSTRCPTRSRAPTDHPTPADDRLGPRGSTTAASSRSSRSTTSRPSWRTPCDAAGFDDARVTTTGRFFLTGVARAGRPRG